jgi:hypothetical protein
MLKGKLEVIESLAMGLVLFMNDNQRRELAIGLRRIADQVEAQCTSGPTVAKTHGDVIDVEGNA